MEPIHPSGNLEAVARSLAASWDPGEGSNGPPWVTRFGTAEVWLVRVGRQELLLKCYRRNQDEDVRWEHDFLDRLSATAFPAPRPIPALGGRS